MGARLASAGAVLALGLASAGSWWAGARPDPSPQPPATPRTASAPVSPIAVAPAPPDSALPPLPASLAGTAVDGGFVVDADGRLVVTRDALDLFDYFLAASGEEPLHRIRARIVAEIERRLELPARAAALDLLDRTLAHREALRELYESESLADLSLERRLQRIRELRREHFSAAEREALFAAEEERWRVDLERRRVATDPDLSPEQRARRLEALEARLPDEVRETRQAVLAALQLRRDEAALRADGAPDAEIHALRQQRFGAEAARRLAALDRERERWARRLDDWRDERARLLAAGAGPEEIAAQRDLRFEGAERLRAEALERIDAPAP